MSLSVCISSKQFDLIHARVHLCMHQISEQLIRTYNQKTLEHRWQELSEAMEEHFEREHQLMQDLPAEQVSAHEQSHLRLMQEIRQFSDDKPIDIDKFFKLQYEFARHELEFDSTLIAN